jgi:hypothetical protein
MKIPEISASIEVEIAAGIEYPTNKDEKMLKIPQE